MVGLNRVEHKQRRKIRRMNHIARDLRTPKYAPRVVKPKNEEDCRHWKLSDYVEEE